LSCDHVRVSMHAAVGIILDQQSHYLTYVIFLIYISVCETTKIGYTSHPISSFPATLTPGTTILSVLLLYIAIQNKSFFVCVCYFNSEQICGNQSIVIGNITKKLARFWRGWASSSKTGPDSLFRSARQPAGPTFRANLDLVLYDNFCR